LPYESTLIPTKPSRSDVTIIDIPAARLAIEATVSERRAADIDKNIKAMEIGFGY